MTAGGGVQHSEMFPLLHQDKENTAELFQIWLNLPKKNKMVAADFQMLWSNKLPKWTENGASVTLICGEYKDKKFYEAPKNSWASDPTNEVNIILVKLDQGAKFQMPKAKGTTNRTLYLFEGKGISLNGENVTGKKALALDSSHDLSIEASSPAVEFLILEAKPIGEPVFQHGPFAMNTKQEIFQAIHDYQQTQFGGWKWIS